MRFWRWRIGRSIAFGAAEPNRGQISSSAAAEEMPSWSGSRRDLASQSAKEASDTIPAAPTDPRRWGLFIHKGGLSGDKAGIGAIVDGASGHSRGFFYVNPRSE